MGQSRFGCSGGAWLIARATVMRGVTVPANEVVLADAPGRRCTSAAPVDLNPDMGAMQ
jgi:hypothetical protein